MVSSVQGSSAIGITDGVTLTQNLEWLSDQKSSLVLASTNGHLESSCTMDAMSKMQKMTDECYWIVKTFFPRLQSELSNALISLARMGIKLFGDIFDNKVKHFADHSTG